MIRCQTTGRMLEIRLGSSTDRLILPGSSCLLCPAKGAEAVLQKEACRLPVVWSETESIVFVDRGHDAENSSQSARFGRHSAEKRIAKSRSALASSSTRAAGSFFNKIVVTIATSYDELAPVMKGWKAASSAPIRRPRIQRAILFKPASTSTTAPAQRTSSPLFELS